MNVVELIRVLQNKIASSSSAEDVLFLTKVMEKLNLGLVRTVSTYAELLNIPLKDTLGEVYFVENEERLYFREVSGGSFTWKTIFGNLTQAIVYTFGEGISGKLGNNSTVNRSSPVSVVGGFTDWIRVSDGVNHILGVRSNGTAWAWGSAGGGRLGDNTTVAKSSPVSVVGGFTDWTQVSAGSSFSLGVRTNGTAWGWGFNADGQLGDNTTVNKSSPVSVSGGFTDWVQVSAGYHCLGVRADGTAWSWGSGGSGRLGDNTTVNKSSPVSVVGGFTDWTQVSAGLNHSLGVRANGTAWAWGGNTLGRLGASLGSTASRSSPVSVVGGFTDWVQVSAGGSWSLGVRSNGTAWAWGNNTTGQLGSGNATDTSSPVSVVGGFTDWVQVSAAFNNHSLGIRANGSLWGWGSNGSGQLGANSTITRSSPVSASAGSSGWVQVSAGDTHGVAIRTL